MTKPFRLISIAGSLILAAAGAPLQIHAQEDCIRDRELKLLGVSVGDGRRVALQRIGPFTVRRDTVAGMDLIFDVTRYTTRRMEMVVSDATGLVSDLIPIDSSLPLPRGIRLGMAIEEVRQRLAPATLDAAHGGVLNVSGCGPLGSGMDLRFDPMHRLKWVSLQGFYPSGD